MGFFGSLGKAAKQTYGAAKGVWNEGKNRPRPKEVIEKKRQDSARLLAIRQAQSKQWGRAVPNPSAGFFKRKQPENRIKKPKKRIKYVVVKKVVKSRPKKVNVTHVHNNLNSPYYDPSTRFKNM